MSAVRRGEVWSLSARGVTRGARLTVAALMAAVSAAPLSAQGVRGWIGSSVQAVELRPITATVPGQPAVALAEDVSVAATQDVSLTAWGFGVQGLSATTMLRGRARLGSDRVWPRTDDAFDVLLGYAQLVRGPLRVRAGRQEVRSGLGFPAFDGASVAVTLGALRLEGYGGRSLARGLREPVADALRGLEDFVPDPSVRLWGGSARARTGRTSLTARYQREILADGSGLTAERGSIDLAATMPGARLEGSLDYDFAFARVGKSHVTLGVPLAGARVMLEATGRRYVPYFSLSTIWGFFEPVAYDEAVLRVGVSPSAGLGVWAAAGYRAYGDAGATEVLEPLEDDGWRAQAGARWQLGPAWSVDGSYRLELGPGGFLSSGDASVRWRPHERLAVAASGTTFQQIEQFRLGDGRAVGGGLSFAVGLTRRATLTGGFSVLRHRGDGAAIDSPWNQSRGWSALRVGVGSDPGLTPRRRP